MSAPVKHHTSVKYKWTLLSVRTFQSTERGSIAKAERSEQFRACRLLCVLCAFVASLIMFLLSVTFIAICVPLRPEVAFAVDGLRGLAWHDKNEQLFWAAGSRPRIARGGFDSNIVNVVGPNSGLESPHSVAVDAASDKIYWTNSISGTIQRADISGTSIEDVVTTGLQAPAGIAVGTGMSSGISWLFWANRGNGTIQRAQVPSGEILVEPFVETIATPGSYDVHSVAVDSTAGKVYWSLSSTAKIQRSNVDGTGFEELVTSGLERPEGLALDAVEGKIYWVDAAAGKVRRARSRDGGGMETLFHSRTSPQGLALDLAARELYWGDMSGSILRASMATGGECVELVLLAFGNEVMLFVLLALGATCGCLCACCLASRLLVKAMRHRTKRIVQEKKDRIYKATEKKKKERTSKALENWHRWTAGALRSTVGSAQAQPESEHHISFAVVTPASADEPVATATVRTAGADDLAEPAAFVREGDSAPHPGQDVDLLLPLESSQPPLGSEAACIKKPSLSHPDGRDVSEGRVMQDNDDNAGCAPFAEDTTPAEIVAECGGSDVGPVEVEEFRRSSAAWCLC